MNRLTRLERKTERWTSSALMIMGAVMCFAPASRGQGSPKWPIPCMVNYLRLRIATGGDDLRGWDGMSSSKDNLNVTVDFGAQGSQRAANVNNNAEWANNSVHLVEIKFNQPVPLNNIRGIELQHTGSDLSIDVAKASTPAGPAAGIQTADNWNMQWLELMAFGGGGQALILHYGAHRFTGSDRTLRLPADIPANSCEVSERFGRLNPASKTVQKAGGTVSKYAKEQRAPSRIQPVPKADSQQLQNNRLIQQAMAHTVQIGPRANTQGGDGGYSALIGLLRKQSTAAHALLLPAFTGGVHPAQQRTGAVGSGGAAQNQTLLNPGTASSLNPQPYPPKGSAATGQTGTLLNGGTKVALNPQPYPPKGSAPQISAGQTMSAPGNSSGTATPASSAPSGTTGSFNLAPAAPANSLTPTNGPTAHQAPGGRQPLAQPVGARAPMPTQICKAGIAAVDGGVNGVWFSPVAGQDGQFVIQGCGFGNAPGEVYLSGVQYDPMHAKVVVQHLGAPNLPDRVNFTIPPNEWKGSQQFVTSWSDRQIVAQIDPNAGGLYDTNNVTLNVKTASGQIYQATGMNFLAARADQLLKGLPLPAGCTPQDTGPACFPPEVKLDVNPGKPRFVHVESPSISMLNPGETIAVGREYAAGEQFPIPMTPGHSFPGGTDTYQLNLAPGFQLDPHTGVNLRHASVDVGYCQSVNGVYSNSGQWALNYTSKTSFQISWQEEACWPKAIVSSGNYMDLLNYASVSAYELEIVVLGPRGVSPLASGKVNPLAIKQIQPVQMLQKQ